MTVWSGYIALGTYSAGVFTEQAGSNYARQAWSFGATATPGVIAGVNAAAFGNGPFAYNAFGFFAASSGGSPTFVYPLVGSTTVAAGNSLTVQAAHVTVDFINGKGRNGVSLAPFSAIEQLTADGNTTQNVFFAPHFGGIWDGSHDISGAINAAIAVAVAAGNGEVSLPAGTWPLASPLTATGGFTLRGRGAGTILIVAAANASSSGYLLSLSSISNVIISDLVFDGGGESSAQASPLTQLFHTTNITLRNITWQNCGGIGLNASGVNQTKIENPIVNKVGNRWKSTSSGSDCHQGLSLTNGDFVTWGFDNTITGGKFTNLGLDAINLGSLTRTTVLNNKFSLADSQAAIVGAAAVYAGLCTGLTIADNHVVNATGNGIDVVDTSNLVIRGNTVIASSGCGIGLFHPNTNTVAFTGSIAATTLTVPGGTLVTAGMILVGAAGAATAVVPGTYITGGSGTSWTVSISQTVSSEALLAGLNIRHATIVDNVCKNNNQGASQTWKGGISIGDGVPDGLVIAGNVLSDDQAIPTQAYGIQVASSGNAPVWNVAPINLNVDPNNVVSGNVTAAVLGAGDYGFYSNTSGTGGSAAITVTIATPGVVTWAAHGLQALAPVYFSTTGALPTGITAFTAYYVAAGTITANTFQIATTIANAQAGTCVVTSGSQSGTQTGHNGVVTASATAIDVVGVMLPAGTYDVQGIVALSPNGSTSVTEFGAWVGSAGASALPYNVASATTMAAALASGLDLIQSAAIVAPQWVLTTGTVRITLAAAGFAVLSAQATYTVSSNSVFGTIRARLVS